MNVYKTGGVYASPSIEEVEVLRVTAQSVFLASKRRNKPEAREAMHSEWHNYFMTWEEAHAFLLNKAEVKLIGARRALEAAQSQHGNVKGMRKPPPVRAYTEAV